MDKIDADTARRRIAEIVESLPEATAMLVVDQHLKLEVYGKTFGWFMEDHHGDGRLALNCKALPGVAQAMTTSLPQYFHIPAYVGHRGWIGIWLGVPGLDWDSVQSHLEEAYVMTASKKLLKANSAQGSP